MRIDVNTRVMTDQTAWAYTTGSCRIHVNVWAVTNQRNLHGCRFDRLSDRNYNPLTSRREME